MSKRNEASQRQRIYFSGRVQGVGFRYTTERIARRFDVQGFVQNLDDGRVLVEVEGAPDTITAFVGAVEAEMADYIRGRQASPMAASGQSMGFVIRY